MIIIFSIISPVWECWTQVSALFLFLFIYFYTVKFFFWKPFAVFLSCFIFFRNQQWKQKNKNKGKVNRVSTSRSAAAAAAAVVDNIICILPLSFFVFYFSILQLGKYSIYKVVAAAEFGNRQNKASISFLNFADFSPSGGNSNNDNNNDRLKQKAADCSALFYFWFSGLFVFVYYRHRTCLLAWPGLATTVFNLPEILFLAFFFFLFYSLLSCWLSSSRQRKKYVCSRTLELDLLLQTKGPRWNFFSILF